MKHLCIILICLFVSFPARASSQHHSSPTTRPLSRAGTQSTTIGELYCFDTCALCRGMLGGSGQTIVKLFSGREIRFCSDACVSAFERAQTRSIARLDQIMIADQLPCYPLRTSLVSGKPLPDKPLDWIWGNRLIRLADESERATFLAKSDHYIAKLNAAAIAAQLPHYRGIKCPVQGDALETDADPDAIVFIAGRMMRVCCTKCADTVRSHPSNYRGIADYLFRQSTSK